MDEKTLPTLNDLVDYVVRDLQSISSLAGLDNAWQDVIVQAAKGIHAFWNVYLVTIEGIVLRELAYCSDDLLANLWENAIGAPALAPVRNQMVSELTDRVFHLVCRVAGSDQ
jgi:hypothetical protein